MDYLTPDYYLTPDEIRTLNGGGIIQTIKMVRQRTGLGLRESKAVVDRYGDALGLFRTVPCYHCQGTGSTRERTR